MMLIFTTKEYNVDLKEIFFCTRLSLKHDAFLASHTCILVHKAANEN